MADLNYVATWVGFRVVSVPTGACDDGIDNDGDRYIDWDGGPPGGPADPGFRDAASDNEAPGCQDGSDNDGDGLIDFDGGQSIWGPCSGEPGGCPANVSDPEGDGVANPDPQCLNSYRNNEAPSNPYCGVGIELVLFLPPLMWMWRRRSLH